jgi:hypothetical protein
MGDTSGPETSRLREQLWRLLFVSAAALLVVGLAFDGFSEGGSELARSIVVVGGTVIVLAALLLLLSPLLYRRPSAGGGWRALQVAAPVLVVGVVGPAMVAAASATTRPERAVSSPATAAAAAASTGGTIDESQPHGHDPVTGENVPAGEGLASEITGNKSSDHGHGTAVPEQPLDRPTRNALGMELTVARDAALKYPTVADAVAAGYRMVTPYVPLIGAHYLNFGIVDTTFDAAKPEMLLYDGTKPDDRIVGLSYFVAAPGGKPPAGFIGPNDHWHQHIGLCVKNGVVVGGEKTTPEQCKARGGNKIGLNDIWMVHAWVVPGWDSPQGVFSPEHLGLV